jgi:hypothetical protein
LYQPLTVDGSLHMGIRKEIKTLLSKADDCHITGLFRSCTLPGFTKKINKMHNSMVQTYFDKKAKAYKYLLRDQFYHPSPDEMAFFKKAIIGGISDVQYPGKHTYQISCLDVVSLYVWAMIFNEYPDGAPTQTSEYVAGKLGIYECSNIRMPYIESDTGNTIGDVPGQQDDRLDWHASFIPQKTLSSVDIERIIANGGSMDIGSGYYWIKTWKPFEMLKMVTREKMRQDVLKNSNDPSYNVCMRETCKLSGNSLFGKMLETVIVHKYSDITHGDIKENSDILFANGRIIEKTLAERTNAPVQTGVFILAYSRNLMLNLFDHVGRRNVIATETDSMYIASVHLPKMEQFINKHLGSLDSEFGSKHCTEAYFLGKKCYGLTQFVDEHGNVDQKMKLRFKGVPSSSLNKSVYDELYSRGHVSIQGITMFKRELFNERSSVWVGKCQKDLQAQMEYREYKEPIQIDESKAFDSFELSVLLQ